VKESTITYLTGKVDLSLLLRTEQLLKILLAVKLETGFVRVRSTYSQEAIGPWVPSNAPVRRNLVVY
jgi:hypothetical protein